MVLAFNCLVFGNCCSETYGKKGVVEKDFFTEDRIIKRYQKCATPICDFSDITDDKGCWLLIIM
jgi:hypothetical protein